MKNKMEIKEYSYKNFIIEVDIAENDEGLLFIAYSYHLRSDINNRWETPEEAINDIKNVIDAFIENPPKNYKELAIQIEKSLIWEDYDYCYVDPKVLQVIIENFQLGQTK